MRPIVKFERELPDNIVNQIYKHGRWIINGKIDQSFGSGEIDRTCRAVWTTEGKRIECSFDRGTLIVSQSKEIDPIYFERKQSQ
jgi:hypothetical protein